MNGVMKEEKKIKPEKRSLNSIEVREESEKKKIYGYAALFDDPADEINGFIERIAPGAFKDAIKNSDTRALVNHNSEKVLGRLQSKTLKLKEDEKGLYYEVDPPNTTYANDLLESLARGDIDQSSFQFTVEKEEWDESGDVPVRTIVKVAELFDVSPVTFPWYPDTESGLRSGKDILGEHKKNKVNQQRAEIGSLNLYKAKIKI